MYYVAFRDETKVDFDDSPYASPRRFPDDESPQMEFSADLEAARRRSDGDESPVIELSHHESAS